MPPNWRSISYPLPQYPRLYTDMRLAPCSEMKSSGPCAATPYASTDSLHRTTRLPNSPWRAAGEHVQNLWDLYATPVQSRGELLASGSSVSLEASGQSIDRQLGIEVQRLTPRLSVGVVGGFQIF